ALLMVLWIFTVLTVLVAEFSRGMRDDAVATYNVAEEVQARGVAYAGMNEAIYRSMLNREQPGQENAASAPKVPLAEPTPEPWKADGTWHEQTYWAGQYRVRILDEGGKIPLNRADETLLRRIFANLGLDADAQERVVDAILDWRDPDNLR